MYSVSAELNLELDTSETWSQLRVWTTDDGYEFRGPGSCEKNSQLVNFGFMVSVTLCTTYRSMTLRRTLRDINLRRPRSSRRPLAPPALSSRILQEEREWKRERAINQSTKEQIALTH